MQKKIVLMLGVLLGITETLCAQWPFDSPPPPENQLFDLPYFSIADAWHIDLGKGNYVELELTDNSQLSRFRNIDSLLLVFLGDMKPFQDSLADPVSGKRIDYLIDTAGRKFMRIRETRPPGSTFLLGETQPSLLRTRQDTICIILSAPPVPGKGYRPVRYNRFTMVINRYDQMEGLLTSGLNHKIQEVDPAAGHRYKGDFNGSGYLAIDPSVTIKKEGLFGSGHNRDFSETLGLIGVQNYRNMFALSSVVGSNFVLHHRYDIHTIGIFYGGFLFFAPDAQGHQQGYNNDYVSISYAYDHMDPGTLKPVGLFTNFSFGWFVHREGGFLSRNAYIVTFCGLQLMNGRFFIEPGLIIDGKNGSSFVGLHFRFI